MFFWRECIVLYFGFLCLVFFWEKYKPEVGGVQCLKREKQPIHEAVRSLKTTIKFQNSANLLRVSVGNFLFVLLEMCYPETRKSKIDDI